MPGELPSPVNPSDQGELDPSSPEAPGTLLPLRDQDCDPGGRPQRLVLHARLQWEPLWGITWISLLYRGAKKKPEQDTFHNMSMQLLVSVFEVHVTSDEKNDTKISNFGSVVYFLGHILWDNVEVQNVPLSAWTRAEKMPFRLAIVVSSNPINFINAHSLH